MKDRVFIKSEIVVDGTQAEVEEVTNALDKLGYLEQVKSNLYHQFEVRYKR